MRRLEFTSDRFNPYLPDEAQVNPGAYGFELAHWLSMQLAYQGIVTSYPVSEDWGWMIEFVEDDLEIVIGCASTGESGAPSNRQIEWKVFVRQTPSLIRRLLGIAPSNHIDRLFKAVEAALTTAGIAYRDAT
jgi:hypothetical protein